MKKYLNFFIIIILSLLATFITDKYFNRDYDINGNSTSSIAQKVISYTKEAHKTLKLYYKGKFLACVNDKDEIDNYLLKYHQEHFAKDFPDSNLNLGEDFYYSEIYDFAKYEDVDDQIIAFLDQTKDFSVYTNEISFSNEKGVYAKIFVRDIKDFDKAKRQFLLNFVSENALNAFELGKGTGELKDFGRREISLAVKEKINISKAYANPTLIKKSSDEIFEYLCYGDNKERKYYIVKEGETLEGVSSNFGNISLRLLMLINPGVISKVNQVIYPGMKLNVTYFKSPLTVTVKKELLKAEPINPPNPAYIEDAELLSGKQQVETEEAAGSKNVVYEETYINGVLQPTQVKKLSSTNVKEPIQAVIRVGSKVLPDRGTGKYIWPTDNTVITCRWLCYYNHLGLDLIDAYNSYGPIYAADNGRVIYAGYSSNGWGNYVQIDHGNGVISAYAHMSQIGNIEVGDVVERGTLIGYIGATGIASGPHLHWEFWIDGDRVDPCTIVNCEVLPSNEQ